MSRTAALATRKKLIEFIAARNGLPFPSVTVVAGTFGVCPLTIYNHLNALMDRGIIHVPNTGTRQRFYRISR